MPVKWQSGSQFPIHSTGVGHEGVKETTLDVFNHSQKALTDVHHTSLWKGQSDILQYSCFFMEKYIL